MDKKIIANNIFNTNFNHTLHAYIDIAGGLVEGTLLSQIMYWFSTGRDGKLRAKIVKNDELWIVKSRTDWWNEIRISPKQYDRAIKKLEELGLVVLGKWKFNGMPAIYIRPNYEYLQSVIDEWKKQQVEMINGLEECAANHVESETGINQTANLDLPKSENGNLPNVETGIDEKDIPSHAQKVNSGIDQRGILLTEITNRDYTKNIKKPIYAQTDDCAEVSGKQEPSSEKQIAPSEKKTPAQRKQELADMFDEFWKVYPKKKNKVAAKQAFFKLMPDRETFVTILKAVHVAIRSYDWRKDNGQYIPYPSSWLNGRRWEDEQQPDIKPLPTGGEQNGCRLTGNNQQNSSKGEDYDLDYDKSVDWSQFDR